MDSYKGRHWKRALKGPGTACTMDKWVPEQMKPETSLLAKRTEWKLSYFGHVARRQGSSDEMLTLGKQRWQGEENRHEREQLRKRSPQAGVVRGRTGLPRTGRCARHQGWEQMDGWHVSPSGEDALRCPGRHTQLQAVTHPCCGLSLLTFSSFDSPVLPLALCLSHSGCGSGKPTAR